MAVSKLRNRVVLFRLTQDEYDRVQQACADASARSISDFARARILGPGTDLSSMAQVESRVAELSQAIEKLTLLLRPNGTSTEPVTRPRADAAVAGQGANAFLATSGD
jgi:hypothetical protein